MIRFLTALLLILTAACAQHAVPPPPPPPPAPLAPPPPSYVSPGEMLPPPPVAVGLEGGAAEEAEMNQRPRRQSTRSTGPRRATAAPTTSLDRAPIAAKTRTPTRDASPQSGTIPPVSEAAAKEGVEQGLGAFVTPPPMKVGQSESLKFVVAPNLEALREESEEEPLEQTRALYVGKAMRVTLLPNPSFEVKPSTEVMQRTLANKSATWVWNVKPLNNHDKVLRAKIELFAVNADNSIGDLIDDYSRKVTINVEVGSAQRLSEIADDGSKVADSFTKLLGSWQKTVGALVALIGAIGVLAWRLGLRKAKPAE